MSDIKETEKGNIRRKPGMKPAHRAAIVAGLAILIVAAGAYYWHSRSFESTDNAFIEGAVVQISPRVSGQVVRVCVADNQRVQKGDLLVEIDVRDYELRVAETKARPIDAAARLSSAQSWCRCLCKHCLGIPLFLLESPRRPEEKEKRGQ